METALHAAPPEGVAVQSPTPARDVRRRLIGLLVALSTLSGLAVGFYLGFHTGVKPALKAGARIDGAALEQALPWKTQIATEPVDRRQIARLLDEARANRAQIEAMRHTLENAHALERLRALENAKETGAEASRAQEKANAAILARLDRLEQRLRAPSPGVDFSPTSALPKIEHGGKGEVKHVSEAEPQGGPAGARRKK